MNQERRVHPVVKALEVHRDVKFFADARHHGPIPRLLIHFGAGLHAVL
jgi:hypothetical protein